MYKYMNRKNQEVIPVVGMEVAIIDGIGFEKFLGTGKIKKIGMNGEQILVCTENRQFEFYMGEVVHKNGEYSCKRIKFDVEFYKNREQRKLARWAK